jgi:PST family polysaccharide transporter
LSLKSKTISGAGWSGAGNIARQAFQIITLMVMARFLSPEVFGTYAILMIFVQFMNIFGSMGIPQVIIHLDNPDQRMLSSVFFLNMVVGVVLFICLYFLARPIAMFFGNSEITHLLQIIGIIFIITSLTLVQKALLEKSMLFKNVIIIETISIFVGSATGIVFAVIGFGIYSLIIMSLLRPTLLSIGLWLNSSWRPSFQFSLHDIKKVWNYAFNLTGFSIINYFARNADNFLIGKFIGSSGLGVYSIGYKILLYPIENISGILVRVLFPAFSKIKYDNIRFKSAYVNSISYIAIITFPVMAGLFAVSSTFVPVVFGDKWVGLGKLLMILAPIGMIQSVVTTVGSIYTAKGTTSLMFKIGGLNALITVLSFVIGLPYGIHGVAIAYAIANLIMLYPNLKFAWKQIDLKVTEGIISLMPYFMTSAIMAIIVYFQGFLLKNEGINNIVILFIQILSGILIYFGVLLFFYREKVLSLWIILRSRS